MFPVAANSHSVYVVRNDTLHIFDRNTGVQQLYWYDKNRDKHFGMLLKPVTTPGVPKPAGPVIAPPIATPSVDEDSLYYTTGHNIVFFGVPNYSELEEIARDLATKPRDDLFARSGRNRTCPRPPTNRFSNGFMVWARRRWTRIQPSRRGNSA